MSPRQLSRSVETESTFSSLEHGARNAQDLCPDEGPVVAPGDHTRRSSKKVFPFLRPTPVPKADFGLTLKVSIFNPFCFKQLQAIDCRLPVGYQISSKSVSAVCTTINGRPSLATDHILGGP
jgi:hypothetical protein